MLITKCVGGAILALAATCTPLIGRAHATYYIDPIVAANEKIVDTPLSRDGGQIEISASGGVSALLVYPANDACARTSIHLKGVGPIGADRVTAQTVFSMKGNEGRRVFYHLSARINNTCRDSGLTFHGFPKLILTAPSAKQSDLYTMDLIMEAGNYTHVPLGCLVESKGTRARFDFASLPYWAIQPGQLFVRDGLIFRMIVARQ